MSKFEFLEKLKKGLTGLPESEIEERLNFYSEMIDDRIEEGLTEEEAVAQVGSIDEIISQVLSETPLSNLVKEKVKPKRALLGWEIALLIIGAPLWLSLLLAVFSIIFAIYITIWSVIVSLWAVGVSLAASSLGVIFTGGVLAVTGNPAVGLALVGASFTLAGLSIFWFLGCKLATQGCVILTKKILQGIKYLFIKGVN